MNLYSSKILVCQFEITGYVKLIPYVNCWKISSEYFSDFSFILKKTDFRYIQILWSLEIAETHVGRSHSSAYGKCSADLTVSFYLLIQFLILLHKV